MFAARADRLVRQVRIATPRRTWPCAQQALRPARGALRLADADYMSKSDPCVLLYTRRSPIANWDLVGKTGASVTRRPAAVPTSPGVSLQRRAARQGAATRACYRRACSRVPLARQRVRFRSRVRRCTDASCSAQPAACTLNCAAILPCRDAAEQLGSSFHDAYPDRLLF